MLPEDAVDGTSPIVLDLDGPALDRVFRVAPLVVVGTVEEDGTIDLAPKHMTTPVGERHVAFVCTLDHATLRNTQRTRAFTVSWLSPHDVLQASLAAAPRAEDGAKPSLAAIPTRPATVVDGVVLARAPLTAECRLVRVVGGFGRWRLVVGEIVHAEAAPEAVVTSDEDPHDVLERAPVLAYVHPHHVATIDRADRFPYHVGFRR